MRTPRPADPAIPAGALADHSPDVPAGTLRKVTLAAAAGTVVEWFDFAIYGFLATILAAQFFPHGDPLVSLLETFAVFAVAFALRPVGGAVFGVLGDRVGRKRILALTVLLMSGSTLAIGLLPTASTIGVWAAVLLVICRSLQGLSAGGEYAGAVAYVIEHAPSHRRSRYSSAMPAATFASFSAAALICFGLTAALGEQQMNSWGWRLPFLLAGPMGLVAFYIRQKLDETPAFKEALAHVEDTTEHSGLRSTIRSQWRQMLVLGGYISLTGLSFYTFSTYLTSFLKSIVGLPPATVLASNVIALAFAAVLAPIIGRICDRVGRDAPCWPRRCCSAGWRCPRTRWPPATRSDRRWPPSACWPSAR